MQFFITRNTARMLFTSLQHRKEQPMLDVIMLAVGLGFFALAIGYTIACDHLYGVAMVFDYWLAAIVTVGLLVYLTYALLTPEKF
jgi:K+-transporting ATPase KdpF subunit